MDPVTEGRTSQSSLSQETIRFIGPPPCHGSILGAAPQNGQGNNSIFAIVYLPFLHEICAPDVEQRGPHRLDFFRSIFRLITSSPLRHRQTALFYFQRRFKDGPRRNPASLQGRAGNHEGALNITLDEFPDAITHEWPLTVVRLEGFPAATRTGSMGHHFTSGKIS